MKKTHHRTWTTCWTILTHQYSLREARPEKLFQFFSHRIVASIIDTPRRAVRSRRPVVRQRVGSSRTGSTSRELLCAHNTLIAVRLHLTQDADRLSEAQTGSRGARARAAAAPRRRNVPRPGSKPGP